MCYEGSRERIFLLLSTIANVTRRTAQCKNIEDAGVQQKLFSRGNRATAKAALMEPGLDTNEPDNNLFKKLIAATFLYLYPDLYPYDEVLLFCLSTL